ncbi:omega-hydroxypalmitate O-feruloyl transferase-like [Rhododendron vialii]|uniref:omega-hydroxypalmitate O-feruloyl transferase-like n=1 Tax=Rhododendron vialii TaxID=182163 RepID=UPI00265F02F7|nr:omega-hydroxypalmitate O-feruloyl transferase-like [Rhododendron vialii]
MFGINVERGEPTIVPPAEDTTKKGTLYFLSNLDYNFPCKVRTVYLFKPSKKEGNGEGEVVEVIKNALSKALVIFYPVAGRLTFDSEGRMAVDCTDEGAVFVEAEAGCTIDDIGDDTVSMGDLVYDVPAAKHIMEMPPLAVQVTKFSCGGFAMGICVNHLVFDGQTGMDFINSWGKIARGLSLKVPQFLDRSILKARNPPKIEFDHQEFLEIEDIPRTNDLYNEEIIYKSFGFDTVKLEKLKAAATEDGAVVRCSTFEALSGFIWKSRTQALKIPHDQKIKLLLVVDGRSKLDPPLPENYFGNAVVIVGCLTTAGELTEKPLSYAVGLVQETIQSVTDCYIKSTIDYLEVTRAKPSLAGSLIIASWCRLSFDTTDFGWGRPYLAGRVTFPACMESAIFMAHPEEKRSINVLLGFPASAMKVFQELVQI